MSTKKDAMWRWWSTFTQIQQLSDIMSRDLGVLIDDYLTSHSFDGHRKDLFEKVVSFDEYIMAALYQMESHLI